MTAAPQTPRIAGWHPQLGPHMATPNPGCDFCGVELTSPWVRFGCHDFMHRILGKAKFGVVMLGYWAACGACAPLVRARRWGDLVTRVSDARVAAGALDGLSAGRAEMAVLDMRLELRALYHQLTQELTAEETCGGAE